MTDFKIGPEDMKSMKSYLFHALRALCCDYTVRGHRCRCLLKHYMGFGLANKSMKAFKMPAYLDCGVEND